MEEPQADDDITYFVGGMEFVENGPAASIVLGLIEADPAKPALRLVFPQVEIARVITMFSTAAAHAEKSGGAKYAAGALQIEQVSIDALPETGRVALNLRLKGGAMIPLAMPPAFARQLAATILEEAEKADRPAK